MSFSSIELMWMGRISERWQIGSQHSIDFPGALPNELVSCIADLVELSFSNIELDHSTADVLASENFSVWQALLSEIHYADSTLLSEVQADFELTGIPTLSGVFQEQCDIPEVSMRQLFTGLREELRCHLNHPPRRPRGGRDAPKIFFRRGWLRGPCSAYAEQSAAGEDLVSSRRSWVRQGPKIRPIDDFSESTVNLAVASSEKLSLMDANCEAAVIRTFEELCSVERAHVLFSDVSHRDVSVHTDWSVVSRTFDLAHAYKRLAASAETFISQDGGGSIVEYGLLHCLILHTFQARLHRVVCQFVLAPFCSRAAVVKNKEEKVAEVVDLITQAVVRG
eukprot:94133-Amphidinium_carterae.1